MNSTNLKTIGKASLISLMVFGIFSFMLYPYFKYRIVSDHISYLTIAQRYIEGDYVNAINGYWSPLNSWLLAVFYSITKLPLVPLAYTFNSICLGIVIVLTIIIYQKAVPLGKNSLSLGVCSAAYWAISGALNFFADSWGFLFSFIALYLLLDEKNHKKSFQYLLLGFVIALAYFSKSYLIYSLPLIVAILIVYRLKSENQLTWKSWLRPMIILFSTLIILILPWLYLLHQKYGYWTFSTAGSINMSWALKSYPFFDETISAVTPPTYKDGLSAWEEPSLQAAEHLSPFQSVYLFGKQIFRVLINILKWMNLSVELGILYFAVWLAAVGLILSKLKQKLNFHFQVLTIALVIFPIGYLFFALASRYFWFTLPIIMILGLYLLEKFVFTYTHHLLKKIILSIYFFSFFPFLLLDMKAEWNVGKKEYEIAQQLKSLGIQGSFVANQFNNYQEQFRISYFAGCPYNMYFAERFSTSELLQEAVKINVPYYFYFYKGNGEDYQLNNEKGIPYPELTNGTIEGLKVFLISNQSGLPTSINSDLAY